MGFTSPEHLTDLWEESHRNEPGETRAAELWRTLHSGEVTKVGETIEALARELWDLHEKGSRIATYAVAQGKLSGTFFQRIQRKARGCFTHSVTRAFPLPLRSFSRMSQ